MVFFLEMKSLNDSVFFKSFSYKEIKGKFGLANPHEAVRQLRMQGLCVYANPVTLWDGTPSTKYRIGKPSKAMVAAAYGLTGGDLF
jgi:hypothetical protein